MAGQENAILGVFVVDRVQKEYPNIFYQEGKFPLAPTAPMLQASLVVVMSDCFKCC